MMGCTLMIVTGRRWTEEPRGGGAASSYSGAYHKPIAGLRFLLRCMVGYEWTKAVTFLGAALAGNHDTNAFEQVNWRTGALRQEGVCASRI